MRTLGLMNIAPTKEPSVLHVLWVVGLLIPVALLFIFTLPFFIWFILRRNRKRIDSGDVPNSPAYKNVKKTRKYARRDEKIDAMKKVFERQIDIESLPPSSLPDIDFTLLRPYIYNNMYNIMNLLDSVAVYMKAMKSYTGEGTPPEKPEGGEVVDSCILYLSQRNKYISRGSGNDFEKSVISNPDLVKAILGRFPGATGIMPAGNDHLGKTLDGKVYEYDYFVYKMCGNRKILVGCVEVKCGTQFTKAGKQRAAWYSNLKSVKINGFGRKRIEWSTGGAGSFVVIFNKPKHFDVFTRDVRVWMAEKKLFGEAISCSKSRDKRKLKEQLENADSARRVAQLFVSNTWVGFSN